MDIVTVFRKFKTQEQAIKYLEKARWGKAPVCPYCNSTHATKVKESRYYHCGTCNKQFSVTVGTIFHDTKLPLQKWLLAIAIIGNAKKGISARELGRQLDISKDAAWRMQMQIRKAMIEKQDNALFTGIVEIDECYIGGRAKMENKMSNKTVVVGIVNRDKKEVIAKKVESAKTHDLQPTIYENVKEGSTIITDEWKAYNVLKWNYNHQKVNHSAKEWVKKDSRIAYKIHTNTIEGFWSHLKRGINGIYIWVSNKHINKYLLEYSYRYNKRALTDFARFENFFEKCERKNLSYEELIA